MTDTSQPSPAPSVSAGTSRPRSRRWVIALGLLVILLFSARLAFQVFIQDRLIYHPKRYLTLPSAMEALEGDFIRYTTDDGLEQWAYRVDAPPLAPKVVDGLPAFYLFFYGGGGVAARAAPICSVLARNSGCSFVIVDYRGFGFNDGRPTGKGLLADAIGAYDTLDAEGAFQNGVGVIGHSMGAGVGLALSEVRKVDRLILIAAPTSVMDVAKMRQPWPVTLLLRDDWPNERRLWELMQRAPDARPQAVGIMHGTQDQVVPVWMAHRLAAVSEENIQLHIYETGGHNDLFDHGVYDIARFLRGGPL